MKKSFLSLALISTLLPFTQAYAAEEATAIVKDGQVTYEGNGPRPPGVIEGDKIIYKAPGEAAGTADEASESGTGIATSALVGLITVGGIFYIVNNGN
ncbi:MULTISPECIES: hypothetical protein [Thiomicrorhabdus]|uniref:Uncharacterized protein n=1 Tax=Thiomicrorhabdus heinhorstiae TaxID=2748010 RepID=A0ABS0BT74_9GAMM|nr:MULTISPECIES: hypothetical protein [Thiomicrorhabdus]MBF6057052.1 hypothetical protein [Thiomicrorhabdus heinhorstiae]